MKTNKLKLKGSLISLVIYRNLKYELIKAHLVYDILVKPTIRLKATTVSI